jgi:hypothetical protein
MRFDDIYLTDKDVTLIQDAIHLWGKPADIVENYGEMLLRNHFLCWQKFVSFNWDEDWTAEYDHDLGCRYWIQLTIEYATLPTSEFLRLKVQPLDEIFKRRMKPIASSRKASPGPWKNGPYFWENNTILSL